MLHAAHVSDRKGYPASNSWLTVLLAIMAGLLSAFQIGKVHIALASLRQSFSLSLVSASWMLSALSIVGLLVATPAGTWSARLGSKRSVVVGLLITAVACSVGAVAPTPAALLFSRLMEGIGFVIVVVAAPSLIVESTSNSNLRLALAGWSAYVPGGVALITLLGPFILKAHTWRALWVLNSVLLAIAALAIALVAKGAPARALSRNSVKAATQFREVLSSRGPVLLAVIFGMYTMQHLAVMGFMPTLLHERFGLRDAQIGTFVALAMASNIIGNLAAGALLQRGVSRARLIVLTSLFMALMTVGMFLVPLPFAGFYACMFAFSCVGGLIPSSVMGAAPFHTPSPSLLGATNGLLVQGSNLGTVVGPPLMSGIATHFGWSWVPAMTCLAATVAALLAMNLRTSTHSNPDFAAATSAHDALTRKAHHATNRS